MTNSMFKLLLLLAVSPLGALVTAMPAPGVVPTLQRTKSSMSAHSSQKGAGPDSANAEALQEKLILDTALQHAAPGFVVERKLHHVAPGIAAAEQKPNQVGAINIYQVQRRALPNSTPLGYGVAFRHTTIWTGGMSKQLWGSPKSPAALYEPDYGLLRCSQSPYIQKMEVEQYQGIMHELFGAMFLEVTAKPFYCVLRFTDEPMVPLATVASELLNRSNRKSVFSFMARPAYEDAIDLMAQIVHLSATLNGSTVRHGGITQKSFYVGRTRDGKFKVALDNWVGTMPNPTMPGLFRDRDGTNKRQDAAAIARILRSMLTTWEGLADAKMKHSQAYLALGATIHAMEAIKDENGKFKLVENLPPPTWMDKIESHIGRAYPTSTALGA